MEGLKEGMLGLAEYQLFKDGPALQNFNVSVFCCMSIATGVCACMLTIIIYFKVGF
jgi:hypothetical protein